MLNNIKKILIILIFAGILVGGMFLLVKNTEKIAPIEEREDVDEINDLKEFSDFESFIEELKYEITTSCFGATAEKKEYQEKYQGLTWIKESKEIGFIKETFYFELQGEAFDNWCIEKLRLYLKDNLTFNEINSKENKKSFEKENIKCIIFEIENYYFSLECGDITRAETFYEYNQIYGQMNPEYNPLISIDIYKVENDFALIEIKDKWGIGAKSLIKKENNRWTTLQATQENFLCEIIFEEEVPTSLIDSCISYQTGELLKYNQSWEVVE